MAFPKGFPQGFDLAGCINVTIVLKDFQVLTGRFKGFHEQRANYFPTNYGSLPEHDSKCDCKDKCEHDKYEHDKCEHDKDKHEDKCCKPPKVNIDVEIEEECKFVLLELTRPAAAANLSSFTCNVIDGTVVGISLVVSGTTFPIGSCIAINCENILYYGTSPTFCDIPITIGAAAAGGLTINFS